MWPRVRCPSSPPRSPSSARLLAARPGNAPAYKSAGGCEPSAPRRRPGRLPRRPRGKFARTRLARKPRLPRPWVRLSNCKPPRWGSKLFPSSPPSSLAFAESLRGGGGGRGRAYNLIHGYLLSWNLQHTAIKTKLNELIFVKR